MVTTVELEIRFKRFHNKLIIGCNQIDPSARLIIDYKSNFFYKNSVYFSTQIKVHKLIV